MGRREYLRQAMAWAVTTWALGAQATAWAGPPPSKQTMPRPVGAPRAPERLPAIMATEPASEVTGPPMSVKSGAASCSRSPRPSFRSLRALREAPKGIDAGDPAHPDCIAVPGVDRANDLTLMATILRQALGRHSDERGALSVVDFGGLRFASVDAPVRARGAADR